MFTENDKEIKDDVKSNIWWVSWCAIFWLVCLAEWSEEVILGK